MTISTENGRYSIEDDGTESRIGFERFDGTSCHISSRDRQGLFSRNINHILSIYGNKDVLSLDVEDLKTVYDAIRSNIEKMGRIPLCSDTSYSYARRTSDGKRSFRLDIRDNGDGTWSAGSDGTAIELQDGTSPNDLINDLAGGKKVKGFKLFDYQEEAVEATTDMWEKDGKKRLLGVSATGTGKTVIAAELIRRHIEQGGSVLFLAHTRDLIDQSVKSFAFHMPEAKISVEMGTEKIKDIDSPDIIVATMQSMNSRLPKYPEDHFSMVVIDEAHHSGCPSYAKILERFPNARVLGITATPERSDETGKDQMDAIFEATSYRLDLEKAIRKKILSPVKILKADLEIDVSDVEKKKNTERTLEYTPGSSAAVLSRYFDRIAAMMTTKVRDRRPAVFLPTVAAAKAFASKMEEFGWHPLEIDAKTPDRKALLNDFRTGKYDVIVSVDALREGFDCSSIDCIVPLRPTTSPIVYKQMVGRGTRLCPERAKSDCIILDFLWKDSRPGLFRSADIFLEKKEEREAAEKILATERKPVSLSEIAERARQKVIEDRKPKVRIIKGESQFGKTKQDRNLLRSLDGNGRTVDSPVNRGPVIIRDGKQVRPVSSSEGINDQGRFFSVNDYILLTGMPSGILFAGAPYGKGEAVTSGQKEALLKAQIDWRTVKDKSQAAALIGYSKQRFSKALATPRMLHRLKEVHGFDGRVEEWSFNSAKKVLDMLRENRVGRLDRKDQDRIDLWLVNRLREEYKARSK